MDGDTSSSQPTALPWPAAWQHRASSWTWVNLCLIGVVAVGLGLLSAAALADGDRQGLFFGAAAVMCALVVVGVALLQRTRRRRPRKSVKRTTASGEQGVRLPYSAGWFGWLVALIAVTGVMFAGVLWWASVDGLAEPRIVVGAILGLVAVPYCGWFLLDTVRGGVVRGGLVLTPRGVHHRYLVVDEFVPWDSIFMVAPGRVAGPTIRFGVSPGRVQRRITSLVALRRASIPEPLPVYGRLLAIDPALAYYAVNFYWANRQARAELATDVGLERIRTGDLLGG